MPFFHFTIVLILLFLPWQDPWEKEVDKKGVQVYTKSVDNFSIKAFKATTIINASPEDILEVVTKIEDYTDWVADCSSATLIFDDKGLMYIHIKIDLPFPVKGRDIVQSFEIVRVDNETIELKIVSHPDLIEEDEDFIRMHVSDGKWTIKELQESQTEVSLEMQNDPGGSVPDWLVNSLLTGSPFKTILNLKNKFPSSAEND